MIFCWSLVNVYVKLNTNWLDPLEIDWFISPSKDSNKGFEIAHLLLAYDNNWNSYNAPVDGAWFMIGLVDT